MKRKGRRPGWVWLWAIFGLMLVLFYLESKLALSGPMRIIAQLGVLVIVYFLTDQWVSANLPFDPWS
jgi:hypothetical protein